SGSDTLTLGDFVNVASIANVETLVGGSLADTITLTAALTSSSSIDLGAGKDILNLGKFANTGSVSNVETLIGSTIDDTITYATQVSNGS
ncbi:hypothetical protein, partial [Aeromonas veronii]|uniref:hypothetical protein n=1 Tax=Aeromonas veronii TaxID=654 RepID=UPI00214F391D